LKGNNKLITVVIYIFHRDRQRRCYNREGSFDLEIYQTAWYTMWKSNLVNTTRYWNDIHRARLTQKDLKAN